MTEPPPPEPDASDADSQAEPPGSTSEVGLTSTATGGIRVQHDSAAHLRFSDDVAELTALARAMTEISPELTDRLVKLTETHLQHRIEMDQRAMGLREKRAEDDLDFDSHMLEQSKIALPGAVLMGVGVLAVLGLAIWREASIIGVALVFATAASFVAATRGSKTDMDSAVDAIREVRELRDTLRTDINADE